ncbi:MAG: hypothetical protein J5732_02630 [Bacteroidaceae bacterium]|nr:hypothetical protein [Bacteroidaceae bacterium]
MSARHYWTASMNYCRVGRHQEWWRERHTSTDGGRDHRVTEAPYGRVAGERESGMGSRSSRI